MTDSVFSFDDESLDFSWSATFDTTGERIPDGVWFAINNGPQPRADGEGLAIFYGDGATGRVSAYVYDNTKRKKSWEIASNFLETYPSSIAFTPLGGNLIGLEVALNAGGMNEAFPGDPDWRDLS
jgi:hypothetical protein